jgi:hypothetical protein
MVRVMRFVLPLLALLAGCGANPCQRTCTKLASCKVVTNEAQCEYDCKHPPNGGRTCSNEDAIATCIENASCDDLTKESSRLKCPACQ